MGVKESAASVDDLTTRTASTKTAVRGGSVTLVGQFSKLGLQVIGLFVLARLLTPTDFGLVAMVTAVVGFADVVRDLGLSSAAIQADRLSRGQKSNLFWINSGLGLVLTAACAGGSFAIAALYHDPRLLDICLALSVTFLFNGLQTQFGAELSRQLRFVALTITDLVSAALPLLVAIGLALAGWGYWALVVQIVLQSFTTLVTRVVAARWWPGLPSRTEPTRELLRYGWNLMLTQVLVYFSSNIDKVIIGSRFGAAPLGLYTRAMQLIVLPINQIFAPVTNVALPVLSRLRTVPERLSSQLLGAQVALGYPVAFFLAAVVAVADPFIPLAMGSQWGPVVPLFRLLAVSALFQAVNYVVYWIFLVQGRTGSHFRYSLVSRSILVLTVVTGSLVSLQGVAVGYVVGVVLPWPLALFWVRRWSLVPVRLLLGNGARIVVAGILAGAAGYGASLLLVDASLPARLGVPFAAVVVAFALLACLPGYRSDLGTILGAARHLRPGQRVATDERESTP